MKTDAQVSKSDPNLRGPKDAKDWICLVISDFFKGEDLIPWKTKKPLVFFYRLERRIVILFQVL